MNFLNKRNRDNNPLNRNSQSPQGRVFYHGATGRPEPVYRSFPPVWRKVGAP